ncbi:MAG TPA: cytochrome c [Chthoniobacteraceae bacterium]|nr:cytochrome c [Chthoniobacteraceae bacterium]
MMLTRANLISAFALAFCAAASSVTNAEPPAAATPEQLAEGKKQYMLICIACHQPTGMGLPPVFPPLTKSEYVNGTAERLIAMVLKGNAGPMTIDGKPYNNIMPGQELVLKDEQIAAVLSFVRQNFGNNAPAIVPEMVAAARKKFAERKTPWTEPELKAWKEDAAATATAAPLTKPGS